MSNLSLELLSECNRKFVIEISREFNIRAKNFKPDTVKEVRWEREGMLPIFKFDTWLEAIRG